ncbi:hypothetical protein O3M35_005149 [Rhynocoris fuscipes]|uniref:Uncharacterized protein n=2 Tax=Rhynocoris fuscipes TaxID=488301 RepID=A0AAW1DJJ4_9HEMI
MVNELNGKKIGSKVVKIKMAHTIDLDMEQTKTEVIIPALGHKDAKDDKKLSRISQIHAIESKLKMMQELPSEEFQISNEPSTSRCLSFYNLNKQQQKSSPQRYRNKSRSDSRHRPYIKK